jgi:tRNA pseudouridine38-40 synthase
LYNYRLIIEFDGLGFSGWQRQKHTSDTIQEQIEVAAGKLLKEKVSIIGAGRTDSGVSAYNQVANFHYKGKIDLPKFRYSLNSILPGSITVKSVSRVPQKFHSRYSAVKRSYVYKITTNKKSIGRDEYYRIKSDLNFQDVERFIELVKKQTNFRSFCKNKEDKFDFFCRIFEFKYRKFNRKGEILFTITASRFLHSMVRCLIGCAIETGSGKMSLKYIKDKIKKGEKVNVHYLPANALFLNKIYYLY